METDPERLDLSALEPFTAPGSLESAAARIAARVVARRRRPSLTFQLVRWARPALVLAAAAMLLAWAGALSLESPADAAETSPALALAQWEQAGHVPSASTVLQVLGGEHE